MLKAGIQGVVSITSMKAIGMGGRLTRWNRKSSMFRCSALLLMAMMLTVSGQVLSSDDDDEDSDFNLISRIVSAPVVANGIVAGEPTEINALLKSRDVNKRFVSDPQYFGHQIPAGGRLEFELGGSFERNGVDNDKAFTAITSNAYFIIVTGLPQNPIVMSAGDGVQHGNYTIEDDGDKIISIVPNGGSGANGLEQERAASIGIKVVHLRPMPNSNAGPSAFTNGAAGTKGTVAIRIYDADGNIVEQGSRSLVFPVSVGRQVSVTNAGLATGGQGNPNTVTAELVESVNFQHVAPDSLLINTSRSGAFSDNRPYAPRFLMFEALAMQPDSFIPFKGIANVGYLVNEDKPWKATLVEDANNNGVADADDVVIGRIRLKGPSKRSMGMILPGTVLTTSGDGISGANGSILNVLVKVGRERGAYKVVVSLKNGNKSTTTIVVD